MRWYDSFFAKKVPTIEFWGTGALPDTRPDSLKAWDVHFGEIVARANPVDWSEKPESAWRTYPVRNQGRGNSCMANAGAKALGVLSRIRDGEFITFSAAHIYQRRINKPGEGMMLPDVFRILSEGVTLEALVPSEQLLDATIDSIKIEDHEKRVGDIFASHSEPIYIPPGDFDTVASVIQTTGKAVVGMFYFTSAEYSRFIPVPADTFLTLNSPRALRHGIAIVDAFMYQGQPVLLAEDSAHFGGFSRRLLTREFFTKRNFGTAYPMQFKFDELRTRPVFTGSIMSAQECLRFEGLFPTNVTLAESIGPVTKRAILNFQEKHGITPIAAELGPKTRAKLQELYGPK